MMNKTVREEWKHYLFEEGDDYTLEETIEKFMVALGFLKDNSMRVSVDMILGSENYDLEFRLSEEEKAEYIQKFNKKGYALSDCEIIVKVMDNMYHTFVVSKEEAFEMAKHGAENQLTITQIVSDKLKVDFGAVGEFIDTVLPELLNYFKSRTMQYGKDLIGIINEAMSSLE